MKRYIDDFVEDLNYRKVILYIGILIQIVCVQKWNLIIWVTRIVLQRLWRII